MFGEGLADLWDLMYERGRGKDHVAEVALVEELVRRHCPQARSLLDAGCGTGSHLAEFAKRFDEVEGFDLSPAMVARARAKSPAVGVEVADIAAFDTGRRYDAVVSLYTVVGYLPSWDALVTALGRLAAHVAPGGVIVVEPWWFAENYLDGYVATDMVEDEHRTVARMSCTRRSGDRARMDIHYLVTDGGAIEHVTESHEFGVWSRAEYEAAFVAAGCDVEFVGDALYCGLFVGRVATEESSLRPFDGEGRDRAPTDPVHERPEEN